LLGRDRELRILHEALARVEESETAAVVTVLGEAGLGKSRLIGEFVDGAAQRVRTLRGRCLSYGEGITFYPLVEIVRQAAGLRGDELSDEVIASLTRLMRGGDSSDAVVKQLAPLLGATGEPGSLDDVAAAVTALIDRVTQDGAALLLVDDVHWAQPGMLDLLEAVVRRARDLPLLTVVAARPEFLGARPTWGTGFANSATLQLEPLRVEESRALAGALGVPADVVDRLSATAEGNPLFLEQLAAHVDDATRAAGSAVPATIQALLAARLDQLDGPDRHVMAGASIIGQVFRIRELVAVTELDEVAVRRALDVLVTRQVVRRRRADGADVYTFRHVLVQEAAYDGQSKADRSRHHLRYAQWLAANPGEAGGEHDAIRGFHLEQAARLGSELAPLAEDTLQVRRLAAAALEQAAIRNEATDWNAAAGLFARAAALCDDPHGKAHLLLRAAGASSQAFELGEVARRFGSAFEAALVSADPAMIAVAEAGRAVAATASLDAVNFETIVASCRHAYDVCLSADYRFGAVLARVLEVNTLNVPGRWADMARALVDIASLAHSPDVHGWQTEARRAIGACLRWGTTPAAEAVTAIEELEAQFAGSPFSLETLRCGRSVVLAMLGRGAEAEALLPPMPAADHMRLTLMWTFAAAWAYRYVGRDGAAIAARAGELALARGNNGHGSTLMAVAAMFAAERGEPAAEDWCRRARETTPPGDTSSEGFWRAAAAMLEPDLDRVRELAREAVHWMDLSDHLNESAEVRRFCSIGLRRAGDAEAADALLREALAQFEDKGNVVMAARCRSELGVSHSETDAPADETERQSAAYRG
jgi:hypothetical protein